MAISVIKVKELEGINKILEKEELLVKDPVEFMKNVRKSLFIKEFIVISFKKTDKSADNRNKRFTRKK